jgi:hypothetical protein
MTRSELRERLLRELQKSFLSREEILAESHLTEVLDSLGLWRAMAVIEEALGEPMTADECTESNLNSVDLMLNFCIRSGSLEA